MTRSFPRLPEFSQTIQWKGNICVDHEEFIKVSNSGDETSLTLPSMITWDYSSNFFLKVSYKQNLSEVVLRMLSLPSSQIAGILIRGTVPSTICEYRFCKLKAVGLPFDNMAS